MVLNGPQTVGKSTLLVWLGSAPTAPPTTVVLNRAGELRDEAGEVLATATVRIVRPSNWS